MRTRNALLASLASIAICVAVSILFGMTASVAVASLCLSLCCAIVCHHSLHAHDAQLGEKVERTPEPEPEVALESKPEIETELRPGSEPEPETETGPLSEANTEPDPIAQLEKNPQSEPEPEPESELEPTPKSQFAYEQFRRTLALSSNPLDTLRETARSIGNRLQNAEPICGVESFLARQIDELGLDDERDDIASEEMPILDVVVPRRTSLYYLRVPTRRVAYGSMLRVLRLEAALNALAFASEYYDDLSNVSEQDIYKLWQRTRNSICAQAPIVDTADWSYLAMPWQAPFGPAGQGEWAARHALSEAIESARLPYRLEATFRCSVANGNIGIEFNATPSRAFPRSAYVSGLGIVPTTAHMRAREASSYAARLGILLAGFAFGSSTKIRRVCIAAKSDTPTSHTCLYSAQIDRRSFAHVRTESIPDPLATLRSLGATFEETDGVLMPSAPGFYLEEDRFCPAYRYDLWNMSERSLPAASAQSLGTSRVSGLLIHESLARANVADHALSALVATAPESVTQDSVHAILSAAHETSDMSVWSAAERVAAKLVYGQLDANDPESIRDELVDGSPLNRIVEQAQRLIQHADPLKALGMLESALAAADASQSYVDTNAVAYRSFDTFAERVLYNRLNAHDKRSVVLVPDAYITAHMAITALLVSLPSEHGGDYSQALEHARHALQIAPMSAPANFGMAACLAATGDLEGAARCLKHYLDVAYHPQILGTTYFQLASIERQLGNQAACQACYQRAVQLFPPLLPFVLGELHASQEEGEQQVIELMSARDIEHALNEQQIPWAPTARTSYILYDGAAASIDAEVFPVARELMQILEMLTGDDVIHGIRTSLEQEPDA